MTRIFVDTEFLPYNPIVPLSIGLVDEDGRELYRETPFTEDSTTADEWVKKNIYPYFTHSNNKCECKKKSDGNYEFRDPLCSLKEIPDIRHDIIVFVQESGSLPEFWASNGSYDYIVLSLLFGGFGQWPRGWPYYMNDVRQYAFMSGQTSTPRNTGTIHNALDDARHVKKIYEYLVTHDTGIRFAERIK